MSECGPHPPLVGDQDKMAAKKMNGLCIAAPTQTKEKRRPLSNLPSSYIDTKAKKRQQARRSSCLLALRSCLDIESAHLQSLQEIRIFCVSSFN
jgi:hypothetical protein